MEGSPASADRLVPADLPARVVPSLTIECPRGQLKAVSKRLPSGSMNKLPNWGSLFMQHSFTHEMNGPETD